MDMPETEKEVNTGKALSFEELEIRTVSFRYPDSDTYVLENVNLKLYKGEKLAIVGENGSGKTTLIKLLCRLYQPTSGEIYNNFSKITKHKTLVSISHRLSSCRMYDRVVVMGERGILQDGSHDKLVMDKDGKYFELWTAQTQYYV